MRFFLLIFVSLLSIGNTLIAQISHGGTPYSFTHNGLSFDIPTVQTPTVDVAEEHSIDEQYYMEKGRSIRFGKEFEVSYNMYEDGLWENLPNGDRLWRIKIVSPNAISLNFIFGQFYMPAHSRLYIYSEDHSAILGAFNGANNTPHNSLGTTLLKGDVAIIEYYEPASAIAQGMLEINTIVHGYRDPFGLNDKRGYGDSGSCNVNINCPAGQDWQVEKQAVAKIINGGFDHCTGTLLNNVLQDKTPYFLTAEHCLTNSPNNWVFLFNYESHSCINQNGPTNQTISGCTQKAVGSNSDFTLLLLNNQPPNTYNAYYAGWDANNVTPTSGVGISHPSGDIKKIAVDEDALQSTSGFGGVPNTHWRVITYDLGMTEGGSSGCGLWNQDHRIVGDLTGGSALCSNPTGDDIYGKFSYSWNTGSSASARLKDWLDPNNSGALVLDGLGNCVASAESLDVQAESVTIPAGTECNALISPSLSLTNIGQSTVNEVVLTCSYDGGADQLVDWQGEAGACSSATISLPQIIGAEGDHTYTVCILTANSQFENNQTNNCITKEFTCDNIPLTAAFTSNITSVCIGEPVTYSGTATGGSGATTWNWTFEGGTPPTSTEQNPSVVYNDNGFYDVSLTVVNGGESDSHTNANFIHVFNNPTLTVQTTATSSNQGTATATAFNGQGPYTYSFNNGAFSSSNQMQLAYGTHTVTAMDANGCTSVENFNLGITGIEDLKAGDIRLFPNPASDYFYIINPNNEIYDKIELYNISGQLIVSSTSINTKIDLPQTIGTGIYFIKIYQEEKVIGSKLNVIR